MKYHKALFNYLLISLFLFAGCNQDELNGINEDTTEITPLSSSSFNEGKKGEIPCESLKLNLQVEYLNPNISEREKILIRNSHRSFYTIYDVFVSTKCTNVEIWEVNCAEYRACGLRCDNTTADPDPDVKRLTQDVSDSCFNGKF